MVALTASFCLHIFFIAISSQLSYQAPIPKEEHFIEVTLAQPEAKKSTVVAAPRSVKRVAIKEPKRAPRLEVKPANHTIHFAASKPFIETKSQPIIKPTNPKVSVPAKPSAPVEHQTADHAAMEDTNRTASNPAAPGRQRTAHTRVAEHLPDEPNNAANHFTTPNPALPNPPISPRTQGARNHEAMELATGNDNSREPQSDSNHSHSSLHYGGRHTSEQPFAGDESQGAESPSNSSSSGRSNQVGPGHTTQGSAEGHDSLPENDEGDTTNYDGFSHSAGLPDNTVPSDTVAPTTKTEAQKHINSDEAGGSEENKNQQTPTNDRGHKKHRQRMADNPFGDLIQPADRTPRNVKSKNTESEPKENLKRTKARLLSSPTPEYPEAARRQGLEGVVHLLLQVNEQGTVDDVQITQGSGHDSLDQAAVDVARNWKFAPARLGNTAIATKVAIPVRFRLE